MEESPAITCLHESVPPPNRLRLLTGSTLDTPTPDSDSTPEGHAHCGIISTQLQEHLIASTNQDSYPPPGRDPTRQTGQREDMLRRYLYNKFRQEVLEELALAEDEVTVMESMTKRDYKVEGLEPQTPQPSMTHHYSTEQALTFWTENLRTITGVSDIRTRDTPFKKTSAFTTPVSHYLDQPVPHSLETYPNM